MPRKLFFSCLLALLITQLAFGGELRKLWEADLYIQATDGGPPETVTLPSGATGTRISGGAFPWDNAYTRTIRPGDLITKGPWVDVRAYIPQSLHAAITARTDNTNLQSYLQSVFDNVPTSGGVRTVYFPDGLYNVKVDSIYVRRSNIKIVLAPGAEIHGSGDFTQVSGDGAAIFMLKGTLATPIHHIGIYGGKISGVNSGSYDETKDFHAIRSPSNGESCTGTGGVTACSAVHDIEVNGVYFSGFKKEVLWGQGYNLLMDGNYFDDLIPTQCNAINFSWDNATFVNNTMVGGRLGFQLNGAKNTVANNTIINPVRGIVIGEGVGSLTSDYIVAGNRIYLSSLAAATQQFGNADVGIAIDDGATDVLVEGNLIKIVLNDSGHTKATAIKNNTPRGAKAKIKNNDIIITGGGSGIFGQINIAYSGSVFDNLALVLKGNDVELRSAISTANTAYLFKHFGDNTIRMDIDLMSNTAKGFKASNSDYALSIPQSVLGTGPLDYTIRDFLVDGGYVLLGHTDGTQVIFDAGELDNVAFNATSHAVPVPASSGAKGRPGMTSFDNTYQYWSYGTNLWRRVPYDNTW